MNTLEAYKIYTALRLHFTTDNFDIRHGIHPRAPKAGVKTTFSKKLEQMMKQYNYDSEAFVGFLVSNFLSGHDRVIQIQEMSILDVVSGNQMKVSDLFS